MAKSRDEDTPDGVFIYEQDLLRKNNRKLKIERKFVKESSVFAYWKIDDQYILNRCITHDLKYWKVQRFVKEKDEYYRLSRVVRKYFPQLKAQHLWMISNANSYPATTWRDFRDWARKSNITEKGLDMNAVNRLFQTTNITTERSQDDNPDNALVRYEFIELLIRIAREKYMKNSNITSTSDAALEKFIIEVFLPASSHEEWNEFRLNSLYALRVNDVMETNIEGL